MDFGQIVGSIIVGLISGAIAAGLSLWISFATFKAQQEEREQNRKEWRGNVEKRLDAHAERLRSMSDHDIRIRTVDSEVSKLREDRHKFREEILTYVFETLRKWRDEMTEKFQPRK